jgi:hypothetical protein
MKSLREELVAAALEWERAFCNAPAITSAVSELDAALLIGMSRQQYCEAVRGTTAVSQGVDFVFDGNRYQVKANRPSGKKGSFVTIVPKARNYDWDKLIWILYNPNYEMQEAWLWDVADYRAAFDGRGRLGPKDYRRGKRLYGEARA